MLPREELGLALTGVEETLHELETAAEPQTIHAEAELTGELDPARLRAAIYDAATRHPMARARLAPWGWNDRGYRWELTPRLGRDPFVHVRAEGPGEAADARDSVLSQPIALDESPPFRIALVEHGGVSSVVLSANHAAFDGIGAARLLRSIARAYAGEVDRLPAVDPVAARHRMSGEGRRDPRLVDRLVAVARVAAPAVVKPDRIAIDGGTRAAGYGTHRLAIPIGDARSWRPDGFDATLNDVLLCGLHLAIDRWNAIHRRATGRIALMMPLSLRAAELHDELVANVWLAVVISSSPRQRRSPAELLRAICAQTRRAKVRGEAAALQGTISKTTQLPVWAKHLIPAIHPLTRNRFVDTAVLSNLGAVAPISFGGDGGTARLAFSPPARMPKGLSVGCVTHDNELALVLRHCRALFSRDAAERFGSMLVEAAASVATA